MVALEFGCVGFAASAMGAVSGGLVGAALAGSASPAKLLPEMAIAFGVGAALCLVAAIPPAIMAARMQAVDALRVDV
jgi:ABC-type antimicrobial peptide transport system permease subunit